MNIWFYRYKQNVRLVAHFQLRFGGTKVNILVEELKKLSDKSLSVDEYAGREKRTGGR